MLNNCKRCLKPADLLVHGVCPDCVLQAIELRDKLVDTLDKLVKDILAARMDPEMCLPSELSVFKARALLVRCRG